jgi:hypothetical protein
LPSDPRVAARANLQALQRQKQRGSDVASPLMVVGEISQESRHVPPHTRELRLGRSWRREPQIHIIGFPLSWRRRLGAIRLSPLHPGDAANERHEHRRCPEAGDELLSFHSITSSAHNTKASGIVGPIGGHHVSSADLTAVAAGEAGLQFLHMTRGRLYRGAQVPPVW